jgi:aspartate 1-decarboxylase
MVPGATREMLKSKIHRATVTQADPDYVGSITIDTDLMAAADLLSGERVDVLDIDNGARLTTYVIQGAAGSGTIGINGAAARLINPGDLVIIVSYVSVPYERAAEVTPRVVFVDSGNTIAELGTDPAGALPGSGLIPGNSG